MALSKPGWLTVWLDWLNVGAGDWLDVSIPIPFVSDPHLRVPPFSVNIGDWIETALDAVLDVVDAALAAIRSVMATVSDIYSAGLYLLSSVGSLITAATSELWAGLGDLSGTMAAGFSNVYQAVADAIAALRAEIMAAGLGPILSLRTELVGLISDAVAGAMASIRAPVNLVNELFDEIQTFFSDPEEYILNKLETALDRFW